MQENVRVLVQGYATGSNLYMRVCVRRGGREEGGGFRPIIKEFSPPQTVAHPDTFMPFYFQAHCSQAPRCDLYCLAAWALQQERQMEGGSRGGGGGHWELPRDR